MNNQNSVEIRSFTENLRTKIGELLDCFYNVLGQQIEQILV